MANLDLSSVSDEDFEEAYRQRLRSKSPSDLGSSIAERSLARTQIPGFQGGASTSSSAPDFTTEDTTPTREFIGQRGELYTDVADVSQGQFAGPHGKGLYGGVIDARAPLAAGDLLFGLRTRENAFAAGDPNWRLRGSDLGVTSQ